MGFTSTGRLRRAMHAAILANAEDFEEVFSELERRVQNVLHQDENLNDETQEFKVLQSEDVVITSRISLAREHFARAPLNLSERQIQSIYPKLQPFLITSYSDLLDIPDELYHKINVDLILVGIIKSRLRAAKAKGGLNWDAKLLDDERQQTVSCVVENRKDANHGMARNMIAVACTPLALFFRCCANFDINLSHPDYDNIVAVLEVVALLQTLILGVTVPMASELPKRFDDGIFDRDSAIGNYTNSYLLGLQEEYNQNLVVHTKEYLAGTRKNSVALDNYYLAEHHLTLAISASIVGVSIAALCFISVHVIRKEDTDRLRLWYQWFFPAIFLGEVSVVVALFAFGTVVRAMATLNSNFSCFVQLRERLGVVAGYATFAVVGTVFFTFLINTDWIMNSSSRSETRLLNAFTDTSEVIPAPFAKDESVSWVQKRLNRLGRGTRVALLNRRTIPAAILYITICLFSTQEAHLALHLWKV